MKPPSKSSFPRASHNGYAVELSFDAGTDAAVRSIWADLAGADVCDFMATFGVHPHISLAVFDELRAEEVVPVVAAFARSQSPLPVTLSSIGVFAGDAGVVFLGAVVTRGLLAAHTDLHERLLALGYRGWPIYEVGEWVPHCTLTQEMPKDHVP